jgi:hypothetical protein
MLPEVAEPPLLAVEPPLALHAARLPATANAAAAITDLPNCHLDRDFIMFTTENFETNGPICQNLPSP